MVDDLGHGSPTNQPFPFHTGEPVRVIGGPFEDFDGVVEVVDEENGKVRVRILFFGRETPIDLDLSQLEKLD